ncbi:MAG: carbohydrate kinase family protein [Bacteroidota bacterium]
MTEKNNQRKYDVLVIGELNIDLILNDIPQFPEIGKEVLAGEIRQTLGSSSAIFANNLSILGAKVAFLGKVGNDSYASDVRTSLKNGGVDTGYIMSSEGFKTGITVAMNFGNDRAMVTYTGAMNDLGREDISDEVLSSARHLHVSSVFLQEKLKPGLVALFQRAKELGLSTSLDPQWDPAETWDLDLKALLPWVDVFLPNDAEILNLTRTETLRDAIQKLESFCRLIVIKNGQKGALLWNGKELYHKQSYLNTEVVDAIGAGDSFNAGFIYRYIQQRPLEECIDFGALTGAVNTTAAGGTGAFSSREAVFMTIKERFQRDLV